MTDNSAQIAALGDTTRRRIFELIAEGPRSVADLARALPVSQSAVSQHLKVLKQTSLVRVEPKGASNIYHIDPAGFGMMRAWLDRFWSKTLNAYKQTVEKPPEDTQ